MSREDMILLGTVIGAAVIGYAIVSWIFSIVKTPKSDAGDQGNPAQYGKHYHEDDLPLLEDPTREPKMTRDDPNITPAPKGYTPQPPREG